MKRFVCGLMALGLLHGFAGQAKAQPTYAFTRLPDPGSYSDYNTPIYPYGINASGQTVGAYGYGPDGEFLYGFLLDNGSYTRLNVPGTTGNTVASGINAWGQIVGGYQDDGGTHGFLLDNGSYITLDVPGAKDTQASGINASGQIVGSYTDAQNKSHGFLLDNGSYTTVDVPGSTGTVAQGINASGQIVGGYYAGGRDHGFLLNNGIYTTLDVPGSISTQGFLGPQIGINNSGQIVGTYSDATGIAHGFLLDNGTYTTIDVPGSTELVLSA